MTPSVTIHVGDCIEVLRKLPADSVHCCVTSPPYWGLRDYGVEGQIGLEDTLDAFVAKMVEVFREVRRVLVPSGTCWINLGDAYATDGGAGGQGAKGALADRSVVQARIKMKRHPLRPKNILGIPWRVALALQDDGWILRQDIIWHKPAPMPESVRDRCTKAHEYLFLLVQSESYHWNREANLEPVTGGAHVRRKVTPAGWGQGDQPRDPRTLNTPDHHRKVAGVTPKSAPAGNGKVKSNESFNAAVGNLVTHRNRRSVWTIPSEPTKEAHFAAYPTALVRPCILAGCPARGVVLDPFAGTGTTGAVALELGCSAVLIELNPDYARIAEAKCRATTPGLNLS